MCIFLYLNNILFRSLIYHNVKIDFHKALIINIIKPKTNYYDRKQLLHDTYFNIYVKRTIEFFARKYNSTFRTISSVDHRSNRHRLDC